MIRTKIVQCLSIIGFPIIASFTVSTELFAQHTAAFPSTVFPYHTTTLDWSKIEVNLTTFKKTELLKDIDEKILLEMKNYQIDINGWEKNIHVMDLNADGLEDFIYQGKYLVEDEIQFFIRSGNRYFREWRSNISIDDQLDGIIKIEMDSIFGIRSLYFKDANGYGPASELTFADYYHVVEFTSKDKTKYADYVFTKITCVDMPLTISMNKPVKARQEKIAISFSPNSNKDCSYNKNQAPNFIIGLFDKDSNARVISSIVNSNGTKRYFGEFEMSFPISKQPFKILGWIDAEDVTIQ
jgi:hypothetical protein